MATYDHYIRGKGTAQRSGTSGTAETTGGYYVCLACRGQLRCATTYCAMCNNTGRVYIRPAGYPLEVSDMKGGTFAKAMKAGFTNEEAAFLALALCETRDECLQEVREKLAEERMRPMVIVAKTWKQWVLLGAVFLCGFVFGMAV